MELRDLTAEDRRHFESFESPISSRTPWTTEVLEAIRERLADTLASGFHRAIGFFDGPLLVAIAAWGDDPEDPENCFSDLLAVRTGYYRRHLALDLKTEVLRRARDAGFRFVTSHVDYDNDPMIELNTRLGARMIVPRDGTSEVLCVIRVR